MVDTRTVRRLVDGVVRATHVHRPWVPPVDHSGDRVGRHGVLAVVNDNFRLSLFEVPNLGPGLSSSVLSSQRSCQLARAVDSDVWVLAYRACETALETVRVVWVVWAVAVEAR